MRFITTKHHLVAYEDSGESYLPALCLVHPLGMSRAVWDEVCDQLHGFYRCIRIDLPGHGYSGNACHDLTIQTMADDILHIADSLDINQFSFIGTSIGGVIGQALCQMAPERLDKVWLTNTGAVIGTKTGWDERAADVRNRGLANMASSIVTRWFAPSFVTQYPDLIAGWQLQLQRTDDESYAKLCEALAQVNNVDKLKNYAKTVSLIAGADDVATPPDTLRALEQEFTQASLSVFAGVGHVPSVETPAALAQHILSKPSRDLVGSQGIDYKQGLAQRKYILGDAHVERSTNNATTFDAPFQQYITRNAWGELWGDNSLTYQQRSMITTGILAALGRDGELELHLRTAKRLGINESQLRQVLMHVAIYAGVPAANHAFALAKKNGWGQPLNE